MSTHIQAKKDVFYRLKNNLDMLAGTRNEESASQARLVLDVADCTAISYQTATQFERATNLDI